MRHSNHFLLMCLAAILSAAIISYPSYPAHAAAPQVFSAKKIGSKCKKRNSYAVGDEIWAKGKGLFKNTEVKIYIVEQDDRCVWKFGDPLVDASGGAETVTTNSKGKFGCTKIWGSASAGNYDIVVDVDQDGEYSSGDAVDSIVVGSGLSVDSQPVVLPAGTDDVDPPADGLCDNGQFAFMQTEDVYVDGEGFPEGVEVKIYVKTNAGWNYGDPIGADEGDGAVEVATTTVDDPSTDENEGGQLPCTKIWDHTLTPSSEGALTVGEYDIVVDVSPYGGTPTYSLGDAINNRCFEPPSEPSLQTVGAGFIVTPTVLPLNGSCGNIQSEFFQIDTIYVKATGLPASTNVDIYVKNNATWALTDSIGSDDGDGTLVNETTDADGNLLCTTLLWATPLNTGDYDIVIDVDKSGDYTDGDVINNSVAVAGFTVKENITPVDALCATKTSFTAEDVYVKGEGFTPGDTVDIYVKTDPGADWTFGATIYDGITEFDDGDGVVNTVDTTLTGELPCTKIWDNGTVALVSGSYDIVVDANQDGIYNAGDAIFDRLAGAGFTVP